MSDDPWLDHNGVGQMLFGVDVLLEGRAELHDKLQVPLGPVISDHKYIP